MVPVIKEGIVRLVQHVAIKASLEGFAIGGGMVIGSKTVGWLSEQLTQTTQKLEARVRYKKAVKRYNELSAFQKLLATKPRR